MSFEMCFIGSMIYTRVVKGRGKYFWDFVHIPSILCIFCSTRIRCKFLKEHTLKYEELLQPIEEIPKTKYMSDEIDDIRQ